MEHNNTSEVLLKSLAALAIIVMGAFLMFGWLKGLMMERELKMRRRR